ncbi:MAG: hypothetical protein LQ340_006149, partial [Diploschistes diacapsis]
PISPQHVSRCTYPESPAKSSPFSPAPQPSLTSNTPQTRPTLSDWGQKTMQKDDGRGLENYRAQWNVRSLDGLPGLRAARRDNGEILLVGDAAATARKMGMQWRAVLLGVFIAVALAWVSVAVGLMEVGIRGEEGLAWLAVES